MVCWGCVTDVYMAPGLRGGLFTFSRTRGLLRTPPPGGLWLVVCTFFFLEVSYSTPQLAYSSLLSTSCVALKSVGVSLRCPCVMGDVPAQGGLSGTLALRMRRLRWSCQAGQGEAFRAEGAACGKGQGVGVVGAGRLRPLGL